MYIYIPHLRTFISKVAGICPTCKRSLNIEQPSHPQSPAAIDAYDSAAATDGDMDEGIERIVSASVGSVKAQSTPILPR